MNVSKAATHPDELRKMDAAIRRVMLDVSGDVWLLCEVVGAGHLRWRSAFINVMRSCGFPLATEDIADRLFHFFSQRVQQIAGNTTDTPKKVASVILDGLEVHERKLPTAEEIANSWEIESGSSSEGQQFMYGGKTKDEVMQQFKGEIESTLRDVPE